MRGCGTLRVSASWTLHNDVITQRHLHYAVDNTQQEKSKANNYVDANEHY